MDGDERFEALNSGRRSRAERFSAKKYWGQHFLRDSGVVDAIVAAVDPGPGLCVLEIGPGSGALTGPLVASGATVAALEIDPDLVRFLRTLYPPPALHVWEGDAASADWGALVQQACGARAFTVVGNLPYYLTGPLLARLWEADDPWERAVVMCQAEVAVRLAAEVGSVPAGAPTVLLQNLATVRVLLQVPPAAFDPPPEVQSTVIEIVRRAHPVVESRAALRTLVRAGFGQRRKTLVRALASTGFRSEWWKARLQDLSIDSRIRAERLSLDQWREISALFLREAPHAERQKLV